SWCALCTCSRVSSRVGVHYVRVHAYQAELVCIMYVFTRIKQSWCALCTCSRYQAELVCIMYVFTRIKQSWCALCTCSRVSSRVGVHNAHQLCLIRVNTYIMHTNSACDSSTRPEC